MMKKVPSLLLPVPAKLPFPRWSKDPWPMPTGLYAAVTRKEDLLVEHAARLEWEDEGGTVRPMMAPGPKLPL